MILLQVAYLLLYIFSYYFRNNIHYVYLGYYRENNMCTIFKYRHIVRIQHEYSNNGDKIKHIFFNIISLYSEGLLIIIIRRCFFWKNKKMSPYYTIDID